MPRTRIRAVFLDAGFTLIHSEIPLPERCARIAREHGIDVTVEALSAALSGGGTLMHQWYREDPDLWASDQRLESRWRDYFATMLNDAGAKGELMACAAEMYAEYNGPGAWSLYPDVLPTMQVLHEQGYVLGVISDWASTLPAHILLPLGVGRYVSHMVVSGAVREAKPGYGLYREALNRAGVQAHEAVHVGDSYVNDILGARAAGILGILLDRQGLHSAPLDCPRITSLAELPALLTQLD